MEKKFHKKKFDMKKLENPPIAVHRDSLKVQEFVHFDQKESDKGSQKSDKLENSGHIVVSKNQQLRINNDSEEEDDSHEVVDFSLDISNMENKEKKYNKVEEITKKEPEDLNSRDKSNLNFNVDKSALNLLDNSSQIHKNNLKSNNGDKNNKNSKLNKNGIQVQVEKTKADEELNIEYKKQAKIKAKIEKMELDELKVSNGIFIQQCQEDLFSNTKAQKELIDYIQQTGNLDTRKRDFPPYILLPNSIFKRIWNTIVLIFSLYTIIIIPVDVGWNISCYSEKVERLSKTMGLLSAIIFLTNVGVNFITAILDEKYRYIINIKDIFIAYLKSYLLFDTLAAIPYNFFVEFDRDKCFDPENQNNRMLLLVGLVRIVGANQIFTRLEEIFQRQTTIIRLLKLFISILYFAHCTGNILVGNSSTFADIIYADCHHLNSIEDVKDCRRNIIKTRFMDIYSYSVYTGYFIITGNELTLTKNWEKYAFVGISVVSMGLTASIFGNVAILISNMSSGVSPVVQEKIDVMKEYMSYMKFEKSFSDTIETYHVNIFSKQRTMLYSDDFFGDLNGTLMKRILIDQWKPTFFIIGKWLSLLSNDFFINMVPILKPKIFMKKDVITSEGETLQDVYFISSTGQVSVKISGYWVKNMGFGEMFGEISVFLRSRRRTATVTSLNDSDYLVIIGKDYERLLRDYPETCLKIKETAINKLMSSIKLYPTNVFAKLVPKNELNDYLIRKSIYLEDYEEDEMFSKKNDNADQLVNLDKYEKEFVQIKNQLNKTIELFKVVTENMKNVNVFNKEEDENTYI